MAKTIEALKVRAHKLEQKDATLNKRIINKLMRQIRALEKKNESE